MEPRNPFQNNEPGQVRASGEFPLKLASAQREGYESADNSSGGLNTNAYSEVSEVWHRQMHEHHSGRSHAHHHHHAHHEVHHTTHHANNHAAHQLAFESSNSQNEAIFKKYPIVDYTFHPVHPIKIDASFSRSSGTSFLTAHNEHSYSYQSYSGRHHERHHHSETNYSSYEHVRTASFTTNSPLEYGIGSGVHFTHSIGTAAHKIASLADRMASAIHTKGNCAFGTRKDFETLGFILPSVVATKQGEILENSRLFDKVSRANVQPGDYGYRHWTSHVIKENHNVDKGDAFIVSAVGRHGELIGSNDHHFVVPNDGARYTNTTFLRPNAEFYKLYGSKLNA